MKNFPANYFATHYAAVKQIEAYELHANRVSGISISERSDRPCAVIIYSADRVYGVGIASKLVSIEPKASQNDGRCGFEVFGIQNAFALGQDAELRCAITKKTLVAFTPSEILTATRSSQKRITVEALQGLVGNHISQDNLDAVWPFAESFARVNGTDAFIEASYRYLLGRPIDPDGHASKLNLLNSDNRLMAVWENIVSSTEFQERKSRSFVSPYDGSFPFKV
jgi:hypothetical protein